MFSSPMHHHAHNRWEEINFAKVNNTSENGPQQSTLNTHTHPLITSAYNAEMAAIKLPSRGVEMQNTLGLREHCIPLSADIPVHNPLLQMLNMEDYKFLY